MHEITLINKIIKIALENATANSAKKILKIRIEIGALADYEEKWMNRYFKSLAKDTIAENAKLEITQKKLFKRCAECNSVSETKFSKHGKLICPQCKSSCTIIGDSKYKIIDMEIR